MKRTVKAKNLIAFTAVLILLFSIAAVPAYAEFPPLTTAGRRMGSWILSALTAAHIALSSTAYSSQGADLMNFLADPLDVNYSYSEMWEDRPTIQIWDDYTIIDGVPYTDIWLSNEAASKFKTNGMDFATAYDIASQTNGTFVSGWGTIAGIPVFDHGDKIISQEFYWPNTAGTTSAIGQISMEVVQNGATGNNLTVLKDQGSWIGQAVGNPVSLPQFHGHVEANKPPAGLNPFIRYYQPDSRSTTSISNPINNPFDFDWVAGNIDTRQLDSDEGMMIRVPSNTPGLDTFINDNPEFADDDGTTIDVNIDPDIMTKLDDLIDIIAPIIPILTDNDINFTINHTEPAPAPAPEPAPDVDPETPVTEITYNDYYQTITNQTEYINDTVNNIDNSIQNVDNHIENIYNQNENIVNNVENVNENVENINENIENVNENIENVVQNQDQIIENQDTIIENQDTIISESIPEIIENIPKIEEICNNIDTAPYNDIDTGLDKLPSIFLPFITDLRSALGIWHYVTEWLAQISTTFAFITGSLAGTSIMTPIYAAIAGYMCIKVYRRMTA